MFNQSHWQPNFGCTNKRSTEHHVKKAAETLAGIPKDRRVMMYLNVSAIHYPNHYFVEGEKQDGIATHAAALRYADGCLEPLFDAFKARAKTFVIACSDHGSCYPEEDDGYIFHGFNHEVTNTVPYKHFFL